MLSTTFAPVRCAILLLLCLAGLAACGSSDAPDGSGPGNGNGGPPEQREDSLDALFSADVTQAGLRGCDWL